MGWGVIFGPVKRAEERVWGKTVEKGFSGFQGWVGTQLFIDIIDRYIQHHTFILHTNAHSYHPSLFFFLFCNVMWAPIITYHFLLVLLSKWSYYLFLVPYFVYSL